MITLYVISYDIRCEPNRVLMSSYLITSATPLEMFTIKLRTPLPWIMSFSQPTLHSQHSRAYPSSYPSIVISKFVFTPPLPPPLFSHLSYSHISLVYTSFLSFLSYLHPLHCYLLSLVAINHVVHYCYWTTFVRSLFPRYYFFDPWLPVRSSEAILQS